MCDPASSSSCPALADELGAVPEDELMQIVEGWEGGVVGLNPPVVSWGDSSVLIRYRPQAWATHSMSHTLLGLNF